MYDMVSVSGLKSGCQLELLEFIQHNIYIIELQRNGSFTVLNGMHDFVIRVSHPSMSIH